MNLPSDGFHAPQSVATPFDAALIRKLEAEPWNARFLHLCRWIEARTAPAPGIGREPHPRNELFRLGQVPSTAFAAREIASIQRENGRLHILLFGLGLYGPNGPLPLHLTEEAHDRKNQKRDTTLVDFLDIFHHRWLSLFYRSWVQGQAAAGLDRREAERFSFYIASLIGHGSGQGFGHGAGSGFATRFPVILERFQNGALKHGVFQKQKDLGSTPNTGIPPVLSASHDPDAFHEGASSPGFSHDSDTFIPTHARLAAAGHLVMRSRNPAGLAATLTHFWSLPFRLEEYRFHWLALEPEDLSCLGHRTSPCRLGQDAVLGSHVPDRQSTFALHLGPLDLDAYLRFLPTGDALPVLAAWVREFVGVELRWTLHLTLRADAAPQSRLGGFDRLGRTTWLARRPGDSPVQGKSFVPEAFVRRNR